MTAVMVASLFRFDNHAQSTVGVDSDLKPSAHNSRENRHHRRHKQRWTKRLRNFLTWLVIATIRFVIDGLAANLQTIIEWLLRRTVRRCYHVKHCAYGSGWREVCDVITPRQLDATKPSIVYIHGGAWIIVSKDLMRPYVTYLARKGGYRVFNADYPLSPETRFPTALISTLRLLHWIKTEYHQDEVILMGDSAGASQAVLAANLLENRAFLEELAAVAQMPELLTWKFPRISKLCVLYGLFDGGLTLRAPTLAARACRAIVDLHRDETIFEGRCTPLDFAHHFSDKFPRTCIMTGSYDS